MAPRTPAKKAAPTKKAAPRKRAAARKTTTEAPHGRNRAAAEATISALRDLGRLDETFAARIATLQALADAVDASPSNASLWREYRAADEALRESSDDDSGAIAKLSELMSSAMGDTKAS